ncbi:MAG: hypothetical protein K9J83_04650 [Desulfarculaceae bacterium]|nr:hypothetical protein [Desulfarculaceae bacterium]
MRNFFKTVPGASLFLLFFSDPAFATQMHSGTEGVIVHQFGHLFFLFSMVVLILTITGKELNREKGWRLIQYAAFFFILWNMAAFAAHLLDNQMNTVTVSNISFSEITITAENGSRLIEIAYYLLKLDHLLCVPAIFFLYRGLCHIPVKEAS